MLRSGRQVPGRFDAAPFRQRGACVKALTRQGFGRPNAISVNDSKLCPPRFCIDAGIALAMPTMDGDQAETAIARIEAALARIEAAAARRRDAQADLAARHAALKAAVAETLGDLDDLIGSPAS